MSVTIRDVAKKAGVGVATVSRVINQSDLVSPNTREAVLNAVAELKYVPNPTARRLSLGKTFTVGVIVPFFTRYSFIERLRGIENVLSSVGYDVIVFNVETPERRDKCFTEVPRQDRVDGVVIISLSPNDTDAALLKTTGVPIVLLDAFNANFPSVTEDSFFGGSLATRHLISLGHRSIAYIGDNPENPFGFTSMADRYSGYRDALGTFGLPHNRAWVYLGEHGRAPAREFALTLLDAPNRPTAIFAASDTQAMGVLEAARTLGLRVPEDISVIGYDDIESAEHLGLTTMRQSLFDSGKVGAQILAQVLAGGANSNAVVMSTPMQSELVVRRTTAAPPG